jgi:curved DNA-binding protein CbpA
LTLYQDLDVPQDSDAAAIKRAHRKAVRSHHPDKGGDRDQFEKIQHAYMILSNPERREKYDKTGSEEDTINNDLSASVSIIMCAFDQALTHHARDLWTHDLIAETRTLLKHAVAQLVAQNKTHDANRKQLEKLIRRIKFKGKGENYISNALRQRLQNLDEVQATCNREKAQFEKAIVFLDDYGFEFDSPTVKLGLWTTTASTS